MHVWPLHCDASPLDACKADRCSAYWPYDLCSLGVRHCYFGISVGPANHHNLVELPDTLKGCLVACDLDKYDQSLLPQELRQYDIRTTTLFPHYVRSR